MRVGGRGTRQASGHNNRRKPEVGWLAALENWADGESRRFTTNAFGGAIDGGARILIDGSAGDARSGRNRKFIAGLARGERAGASRKD